MMSSIMSLWQQCRGYLRTRAWGWTCASIDRGLEVLQVRGLCTYMGMGTEFVRNKHADRRLGSRALGADTGGYALKEGAVPLSAGPGDVLYLKGHSYPGNAGR